MYNDNTNNQNNFENGSSINSNDLSSKNIDINGSDSVQDNIGMINATQNSINQTNSMINATSNSINQTNGIVDANESNNTNSCNTNVTNNYSNTTSSNANETNGSTQQQPSTLYTSNVLNNNSVDRVYSTNQNTSSNEQNQSVNNTQANQNNYNGYTQPNNQSTTQDSSTIHNTMGNGPRVEGIKAKTKKPRGKKARVFGYVAILLVVSLISGMTGGYVTSLMYNNNINNQNTQSISENNNGQNIAINLNNDTYYAVAVNEKAKNSVVGISTSYMQTYNSIFGVQQQPVSSIGSGFIVDSNGYILTNSHVVGDGAEADIEVTLADGTTEKGTVLWNSTDLDLAIVKIEKTGLQAVELGDSEDLVVGEPVVAIGNPMSLELNGTLTTGVISGLNRSITVDNKTIKPLIQTNASINPGNSGGPLFNAEGKVIGINTAKMSSAEGLGFSIPINVALPMLEQVANTGTYKTAFLGISGTDVKYYEQQMNVDLSVDEGVYIIKVVKDSPVKKAGLRTGDIITKVNDTTVSDMTDLKRELYKYKVGDKVTLTYMRDGDEMTAEITLQEKPEE